MCSPGIKMRRVRLFWQPSMKFGHNEIRLCVLPSERKWIAEHDLFDRFLWVHH